MGRGKNKKNKIRKSKDHFTVNRVKTKDLGSGAILVWEGLARQKSIFPYYLIEKIVEGRDAGGDYLEFISKKNQLGQRLHVLERKYLRPGTVHNVKEIEDLVEKGKYYPRWDNFSHRKYEFFIEKNGIMQEKKIDSNSKDLRNRLDKILSMYKAGVLR